MSKPDRQEQKLITDLEKAGPVTITLAASEALTIITMMKLMSILNSDFDVAKEWEAFNENHILRDLRNSTPITVTLSAVGAFHLVTATQVVTKVDKELGIMAVLAEEAGRKIHSSLDPKSSYAQYLSSRWGHY